MGFDAHNNLYIADTSNNRVRLLSAKNVITTLAGTGISGYAGDGGPANAANLNMPVAAAADLAGNVFIADNNGFIIRKVDTTGTITTIASSDGFGGLTGLATDAAGNLYGADPYYCAVWQITPTGNITTVAGVPGYCGYNSDGIPATQAWLNGPYGVALDAKGNIYIGDQGNNLVRKVDVNTQLISSVAGTGVCGFSGDGGPATAAEICYPWGVAVSKKGSLYIADYGNARVRVVDSSGTIQTLAGTGMGGYNGNGLLATQTNLDAVLGVAVNSSGVAYVLDEFQQRVRKIH
jgi:sugar lactone lactonase YvrE